MKRTGPTNPQLAGLITFLRKHSSEHKTGMWGRIADDLEKPTRQRRIVNLYSIDKNAKDNENIIVPGKVLGTGTISRKVNIAAWAFSGSAVEKITGAKGSCMSIIDMVKKDPKGQKIRILG